MYFQLNRAFGLHPDRLPRYASSSRRAISNMEPPRSLAPSRMWEWSDKTQSIQNEDPAHRAAIVDSTLRRGEDLPALTDAWLLAANRGEHVDPPLSLPDASLLLPFPPSGSSLLTSLARLGVSPPTCWLITLLTQLIADEGYMASSSTRQLAEMAWAISELLPTREEATNGEAAKEEMEVGSLSKQWALHLLRQLGSQGRLSDFYGPDLAALVSSCGSICTIRKTQDQGESSWKEALSTEVTYQLKEFTADFVAFDVALMISGLADLDIPCTPDLKGAIMKGVYTKTRTIEDKSAVDFALVKLEERGEKSMLYDPRWTHEELRWLPRRERDKRRILKEGWKRTQWGGA